MECQVVEISLKIFLLEDITVDQVSEKITAFLDKGFGTDPRLLEFHETNKYKGYSYGAFQPIEKDKLYKAGKVYTITIRTLLPELAKYFSEVCPNVYTREIKGLTASLRIVPKRMIQTLLAATPVILKSDNGYWRPHQTLAEFEELLKVNMIKKWNYFHGEKIDENFQWYTMIEFLNKKPIAVKYKNIKLLGDKIRLTIADNKQAQDISYLALATGLGEMNARGAGFVRYQWM
mgnify:FL=1